MNIELYNTLGRAKEVFKPLHPDSVSLYTCGPTVYDCAHIGNFRTYIFEDILRRVLEESGYHVNHAMNITDVGHLVGDGDDGDDKLEVAATRAQKHPLEIAQMYESQFFEDLAALQCLHPTQVMRATDAIDQQIGLIQRLEAEGFTYQDEYGIYFDTSKLPDYGKLTGQELNQKKVGAREEVVVTSTKKNPQDFVLWFFLAGRYESHVLHWPSPWGEGFPGWHVECSAIARDLLGQPLDIHAGGVDHIGTHHTNEIAQSEAAYDTPLANYWLHGEFLLVDGRRMGKSEGNVFTLEALRERGFSPLDFRYLCLTAHYRSKLNFTWATLAAARKTRLAILELDSSGEPAQELKEAIWAALRDDLDTPKALALLHQSKNRSLWQSFELVLALGLDDTSPSTKNEVIIPEQVQALHRQREAARLAKDWAHADTLRQEIEAAGYTVLDTPDGSRLKKI